MMAKMETSGSDPTRSTQSRVAPGDLEIAMMMIPDRTALKRRKLRFQRHEPFRRYYAKSSTMAAGPRQPPGLYSQP